MSDGRNKEAELEAKMGDLQLDNERLRSTLRWIGQYDPSPDFRRIAKKALGGGDWVIINHMMAEATRTLEGKDG